MAWELFTAWLVGVVTNWTSEGAKWLVSDQAGSEELKRCAKRALEKAVSQQLPSDAASIGPLVEGLAAVLWRGGSGPTGLHDDLSSPFIDRFERATEVTFGALRNLPANEEGVSQAEAMGLATVQLSADFTDYFLIALEGAKTSAARRLHDLLVQGMNARGHRRTHELLSALAYGRHSRGPLSLSDQLVILTSYLEEATREAEILTSPHLPPPFRTYEKVQPRRVRRVHPVTSSRESPRWSEPEKWSVVRAGLSTSSPQRCAITAGPGVGKTRLLQDELIQRIDVVKGVIEAGGLERGEDLPLILMLDLPAVLAEPQPAASGYDAFRLIAKDLGRRFSAFRENDAAVQWFLDLLNRPSSVVLVDRAGAEDLGRVGPLAQAFVHSMVSDYQGSLLIGKRPGGAFWESSFLEYELLPFCLEDALRYVLDWFAAFEADDTDVEAFIHAISPDMVEIPLFVSILCLLYSTDPELFSGHEITQAAPIGLLEALAQLLCSNAVQVGLDTAPTLAVDAAARLAYSVASDEGGWSEVVSSTDWRHTGLTDDRSVDALRRSRLFLSQPSSLPGASVAPRRFVHRTLQDYLVARHISSEWKDERTPSELSPRLWDLRWRSVFVLLLAFRPEWDVATTLGDHERLKKFHPAVVSVLELIAADPGRLTVAGAVTVRTLIEEYVLTAHQLDVQVLKPLISPLSPASLDALCSILESTSIEWEKRSFTFELGRDLADEDVMPLFANALVTGPKPLVLRALEEMRERGSETVSAIAFGVDWADPEIGVQAARVLGTVESSESTRFLLGLLLGRVPSSASGDDPTTSRVIEVDQAIRLAAAHVLIARGEDVVKTEMEKVQLPEELQAQILQSLFESGLLPAALIPHLNELQVRLWEAEWDERLLSSSIRGGGDRLPAVRLYSACKGLVLSPETRFRFGRRAFLVTFQSRRLLAELDRKTLAELQALENEPEGRPDRDEVDAGPEDAESGFAASEFEELSAPLDEAPEIEPLDELEEARRVLDDPEADLTLKYQAVWTLSYDDADDARRGLRFLLDHVLIASGFEDDVSVEEPSSIFESPNGETGKLALLRANEAVQVLLRMREGQPGARLLEALVAQDSATLSETLSAIECSETQLALLRRADPIQILGGIAWSATPADFPIIRRAIESDEKAIRISAIAAMGACPHPRALTTLMECAGDLDPDVSLQAGLAFIRRALDSEWSQVGRLLLDLPARSQPTVGTYAVMSACWPAAFFAAPQRQFQGSDRMWRRWLEAFEGTSIRVHPDVTGVISDPR